MEYWWRNEVMTVCGTRLLRKMRHIQLRSHPGQNFIHKKPLFHSFASSRRIAIIYIREYPSTHPQQQQHVSSRIVIGQKKHLIWFPIHSFAESAKYLRINFAIFFFLSRVLCLTVSGYNVMLCDLIYCKTTLGVSHKSFLLHLNLTLNCIWIKIGN